MIKHIITTRHDKGYAPAKVYRQLLMQAAKIVLKQEKAALPCVVNILISDDAGIKEFNNKYRGINKATDVLSFPMQTFRYPGWNGIVQPDIDIDTQTVPLGDIIISTATIKRNAGKFKRTYEHESTLIIVHSVLHLLGYDHGELMEEREKKLMRDMGYLNDR